MISLAQITLKIIGGVLVVKAIQRSFRKYVEVGAGLTIQLTPSTVADVKVVIQVAVKCVK